MVTRPARLATVLALCVIAATSTSPLATFRVVSSMNGYQYPSALLEGSPGLFYAAAELAGTSQEAPLTVTSSGTVTMLGKFPSMYNLDSNFVGGPNNRFYSAVEYSSDPAHVFSVASTAPSKTEYAATVFVPSFTQALADGSILGFAIPASDWYLVRSDINGAVTSFYQFPQKARPLSAIYGSDGNYYGNG